VLRVDRCAGSVASIASTTATSSRKAHRKEAEQTRSRHSQSQLQPSAARAEEFASPRHFTGQDSTSGTDSFLFMTAESDHADRMSTKQSGSLYAIDVAAGERLQNACDYDFANNVQIFFFRDLWSVARTNPVVPVSQCKFLPSLGRCYSIRVPEVCHSA
jgi:hypothetical protein